MLQFHELSEILARFAHTPILVIGDLMIDEYIWGAVSRISPEAPVQIVEAAREEITLGGAGNVAKNLISLKAHVYMCSVVDEGETGTRIIDELQQLGIEVAGVFREKNKTSSKKTRILSIENNQQILRIDRESVHSLSPDAEKMIVNYVDSNINSFKAVILSDYLKGVLTDTLLREVITRANEKGIPVIVDPKGRDFKKYRNATIITPNKKESETYLNISIQDEKALRKAGRSILKRLNTNAVLVTLGKDGMALFKKGEKTVRIPALTKEIFDVTGAGDTVISLLGLGIASGVDLKRAIEIANIAAGIVVGRIGTATVTQEDIIAEFYRHSVSAADKVMSLPTLTQLIEDRRKNGKTIVFTNGCFDILHVGHTTFLKQAGQLGDVLIVGLNSDDSVRRLKGPQRPVLPMKERASVLASLTDVDYITFFDEDTPIRLIEALKPDVLVKGGDYRKHEVVGKEIVESHGGRVELIHLVDGVSTTKIIERIANSLNQGDAKNIEA